MAAYLFVGERRSPTAIRMGVTWGDGRLCAKNLHEALRAAGIEPADHIFINAFDDDGTPSPHAMIVALAATTLDTVVVALGQKAAGQLKQHNVPHLVMVHPAARGRIRKREAYHAHVASVLGGTACASTPAAAASASPSG